MLARFNQLLNGVFDLWFLPISDFSETAQMAVTALPVTFFALLVFRYASNQQGIKEAKNQIAACLLELRLFSATLGVMWRTQRNLMSQTLRYLRYSLPPLVLMLLPMILIAAQVEARFGYRSFEPGEPVLLRLVVDGSEPVSGMEPALSLPAGLIQATPPLRAEKSREILWRIEARQKGEYRLEIELAGGKVEKRLLVETPGLPLAPVRLQAGELASLLFPSEPPLGPSGQIRAVWLDYPRSGPDFAGLSAPTWGLFGFTLLLGFLFRSFFGVTF